MICCVLVWLNLKYVMCSPKSRLRGIYFSIHIQFTLIASFLCRRGTNVITE